MSLRFPDGPMVAPPRALLCLAAAVRDNDRVETRIVDALAHPDLDVLATVERPVLFGLPASEVARRAAEWPADVVAITTMANYYRRETLEIVEAVRAVLPECFVVLGGPDPTVDHARYLADSSADAVCIGEGESSFPALLGALAGDGDWRQIPGFVHRYGQPPPAAALTDLGPCLPDYGAIDLEHYFDLAARGWRSRPTFRRPGIERTVDLVTTRGCPYRCSFCVIAASMGRRFRTRSIEAVMAQLRELVAVHGVEHVHFEDDILNLDRRRFRQLLEAMIDADLPLTWDTPNGVRADLLTEELVGLCRRAGCVYLIFGVESGSQRVLDDVVDKEMDLSAVVEAARWCFEAELDALAFYIVGLPGETSNEADETVRFAFDLFDRFGTTPLLQIWRPYVQTGLFDRADSEGWLRDADPVALSAAHGIPYTQFRDRHAELPGHGLEVLARRFDDYSRRLVAGQLKRWRKAKLTPNNLHSREDIERFVVLDAAFLHAAGRGTRV